MSLLKAAISTLDELIEKELRKIELLRELRKSLEIAEMFGVPAEKIRRVGYDQTKDKRWSKWPERIQPGGLFEKSFWVDQPNYVILDDDTRVDREIDWQGPLKAYREFLQEREKARFNR